MIGTRAFPYRSPAIGAVACALVAVTTLSGCSSSATTAGAPASSTTTSAGASTSAAAGASAASSTSAAPTSSAAVAAGGGGRFCTAARQEQAAEDKNTSALSTSSPAALEKLEKDALGKLQGFAAIAPSAIKGDVAAIYAADKKLYAALADVHFDIRKVSPKTISAFETPQLKKSIASVTSYLKKTCGIDTTS